MTFQLPINSRRGSRGLFAAITLAVLVSAIAAPAIANDVNTSAGMTLAGGPLAIHGFDPVAYFTQGQARVGQAVFSYKYGEGVYRFVSEENKKKFAAAPQRYAPQYGGYCAYGTALGAKFDGDPRLFTIVDGKLYFNLNPAIQKKWMEDIPGNIAKANRHWTRIRDKAPVDLTD